MASQETTASFYPNIVWKEINGFQVEFDFFADASAEGNGGDDVLFHFDFGALNPEVYYAVTFIQVATSATTDAFAYAVDSDWDIFQSNLDMNIPLLAWDQAFTDRDAPCFNRDMLSQLLYLGRPRLAGTNTGRLTVKFPTNTISEDYKAVLLGYALKKPLPLNTLFRQHII